MNNKFFTAALGFATALLLSSTANADNLGQFDARSMAMGGTGVAGAKSANAAAFNPALMATDSNKKSFSVIPLVLRVEAIDENDFIDTVEEAEESVNGDDGLNALLDTMDGLSESCGTNCYSDPNMEATATKSKEVIAHINDLNKSNALVSANTGIAFQFGKKLPMALILDGGLNTHIAIKSASSDFKELNAYTTAMEDGTISSSDFSDLQQAGLLELDTPGQLKFVRSGDNAEELKSLLEVVGASYYELGISFADSFQYMGKELAIGITPKIVKVETIKFHQSIEAEDIETDDILDDDNITSKTAFNADIGIVFKPIDAQPLQVGVTVKNLFTRSYDLKKTPQELALETEALGTGTAATDAATDLANFKFAQELKIEPQITAGVAYDLRFFNLLADIDLNAAEVLGRSTQHLSLGAEFDARIIRVQAGYRTSIGGDDEEDAISAGLGLGPVSIAGIFSGDNIGGVIQTSISF